MEYPTLLVMELVNSEDRIQAASALTNSFCIWWPGQNRPADTWIFRLAGKAVLRFISIGYRDVRCVIFSAFHHYAQLFHTKFTQ
jgi:hypothetical protein